MTDSRNKRFKWAIITIAWMIVCVPLGLHASEQQFMNVKSIQFGPEPVVVTLKTTGRSDIKASVDDHHISALDATWDIQPDGALRLQVHRPDSRNVALPVELTLPEGWSGRLEYLGGGHRLRTEDVQLSRLNLHVTGALDVEGTGTIDQLIISVTGATHWQTTQLKVATEVWHMTGEGDAHVNVSKELSGRLTGQFQLDYLGHPTVSVKTFGQTAVKSAEH